MAVRVEDIKAAYEKWKFTKEEEKTVKKLTRVKLINWHRFVNATIDLEKSTLISGENGAGKSTFWTLFSS